MNHIFTVLLSLFMLMQTLSSLAQNGTTVAGGNGAGSGIDQLKAPTGVFVTDDGSMYIADYQNHRIQKWAPGATLGVTVAGGNGEGSAANQLFLPFGVFVDTNGNIYISDAGNNRIQKWAPGATAGTTVAGGNGYGSAASQLAFPEGIYVTIGGSIYIADIDNFRIQKWAPGATSGTTVAGGNGYGSAANQLSNASGVVVDESDGSIYIADLNNNRVQKWASGATSGITAAGGNERGSAANQLSTDYSIYRDRNGDIYIADTYNNRIQKWIPGATSGTTVAGGNGEGSALNQLNLPNGVFLDASKRIYVADTYNNRIQRFENNCTTQTPTITTQAGHSYPSGVSSLTISQNTGNVILIVGGCAGGTIAWSGGSSTTLAVATTNTGVQTFTATCTANTSGCTSPLATATVTVVAPTLKVLSRDPDNGQLNNNTIKPYLLMQNAGNTPINYPTITLRYWLTTENTIPLLFQKNYVQIGQNNLNLRYVALAQPLQGATGYIEYSFQPAAGNLTPMGDSGPLEVQINKQNYSMFDQRDDYSYINNSNYTLNPRITAYQNGIIFYGQEPTGASSVRVGIQEPGLALKVKVLGNPVPGSLMSVEVSGAKGQALYYKLTDMSGRLVRERQVEQAEIIDRQTWSINEQSAGLFLLRVSTPTQSQTVKVMKVE